MPQVRRSLRSDSAFLHEAVYEEEQREFMRLQSDIMYRRPPVLRLVEYIPLTPDQDWIAPAVNSTGDEDWENYYDHVWWAKDPYTPVIAYTHTTGRQVAEITRLVRQLEIEEISLLVMELHSTRARFAEYIRSERERRARRTSFALRLLGGALGALMFAWFLNEFGDRRNEPEARQEAPADRAQGDGRAAREAARHEPAG